MGRFRASEPDDLIGLPYRLGADPTRHGATDCLHLAVWMLRYLGIPAPAPSRAWYCRLRRGDRAVFRDELERWGRLVAAPTIGAVALLQADDNLGLATCWREGILHIGAEGVRWSPHGALPVLAFYCHPSAQSARRSA